MTTSTEVPVRARGLGKSFKGVVALQDVSLTVEDRQFVSIVGPSGCGKSTLLRMVSGLIPRRRARSVRGRPVRADIDVGMVFQSPVLLPWRSTLDNILFVAEMAGAGRQVSQSRARVDRARRPVRIRARRPHELSGGMQQRVSICRALLLNPPLILMDEPFGALDVITRERMGFELQKIWNVSRTTVIFVTHSISESVLLSDSIIVMSARPGRIVRTFEVDLPRPRGRELCRIPRSYACRPTCVPASKTLPSRSPDAPPMNLLASPAVANVAKSTLAFAILIALWQVVGQLTHAPEHIFPLPSRIAEVFVRTFPSQIHHLGATGLATILGLALALVVGVLLAITVIYFASIKGAVLTVLAAFNSIPKIAVAPLFVIWFGLGIESKILLAFLLAIFPMFVNSLTGLGEIEKDMLDLSKISGGNQWRIFTKVRLMHALPYIADALKVAFPLALVGAIVGEFIGGNRGIGYLILSAQFNIDTALVFAALLSITIFTTAGVGVVVLFEYLFLNWRPSQRTT